MSESCFCFLRHSAALTRLKHNSTKRHNAAAQLDMLDRRAGVTVSMFAPFELALLSRFGVILGLLWQRRVAAARGLVAGTAARRREEHEPSGQRVSFQRLAVASAGSPGGRLPGAPCVLSGWGPLCLFERPRCLRAVGPRGRGGAVSQRHRCRIRGEPDAEQGRREVDE